MKNDADPEKILQELDINLPTPNLAKLIEQQLEEYRDAKTLEVLSSPSKQRFYYWPLLAMAACALIAVLVMTFQDTDSQQLQNNTQPSNNFVNQLNESVGFTIIGVSVNSNNPDRSVAFIEDKKTLGQALYYVGDTFRNMIIKSITNEKVIFKKIDGTLLSINLTQSQGEYKGDFVDNENTEVGRILFQFQRGKLWGFMDKDGKIVIKAQFERISNFDDNGLALINQDGKWGVIDTTGKIVIKPEYTTMPIFSEDLAQIKKNGKWGFINKTGEIVIQPKFDYVGSFSEGLASFAKNGKRGFIDNTGQIVIQPQYDDVRNFRDGLARIFLNGKYGFIDKTGKIVIQPKFQFCQIVICSIASTPHEITSRVFHLEQRVYFVKSLDKNVLQNIFSRLAVLQP